MLVFVGAGISLTTFPHTSDLHPPLQAQAFLAGVAVGLQLPAAGRRQSATQRALLVALLVCGLVVLGGSALLLVGVTAEHPRAVYYT